MSAFAAARLAGMMLLLPLHAASASSWLVDGCGRGGICPDLFTATPTPGPQFSATPTFTPTPSISGTPPTHTASPTAMPSLTATRTPVGGAYSLKIDVASQAGHLDWVADKAWDQLSYGHTAAGQAYTSSDPVLGSLDPLTYQTYREGTALEYFVRLPAGSYELTLKFCDFSSTAAGQRVMALSLNGGLITQSLDLFAATGEKGRAFDLKIDTSLDQGLLLIQLSGQLGAATLAGIEVLGLQQRYPLLINLRFPQNAVQLP